MCINSKLRLRAVCFCSGGSCGAAAHHAPEFRKKWPRFGELVKEAEPGLYDVVLVEAA